MGTRSENVSFTNILYLRRKVKLMNHERAKSTPVKKQRKYYSPSFIITYSSVIFIEP